jgi:hypothetical protein
MRLGSASTARAKPQPGKRTRSTVSLHRASGRRRANDSPMYCGPRRFRIRRPALFPNGERASAERQPLSEAKAFQVAVRYNRPVSTRFQIKKAPRAKLLEIEQELSSIIETGASDLSAASVGETRATHEHPKAPAVTRKRASRARQRAPQTELSKPQLARNSTGPRRRRLRCRS